MSIARPARSLVSRCVSSTRTKPTAAPVITASTAANSPACRQFHNSVPRSKRRSQFRNLKAEELGLLQPEKMAKFQKENFPEYTKEELELLKEKYTPEQLEALQLGEKAVDTQDIIIQGRLRDDMFRPEYIEDYSTTDPRYDLRTELEGTPREPHWPTQQEFDQAYLGKITGLMEKKTSDQLTRAMIRALRKVKASQGTDLIDLTEEELDDMEKDPELAKKYVVPEDATSKSRRDAKTSGSEYMSKAQALKLDEEIDAAWQHELQELSKQTDSPEMRPNNLELFDDGPNGSIRAHSAEAVELGKVPGVVGLYKNTLADDGAEGDPDGKYTLLRQLTGMTVDEIQSYYTKILVRRMVHNQTRLGKVRSNSVLAIAGNGNGRLGLGVAKSTESGIAEETALFLAIRNMKPIRRYENRTVYGKITAKVGGTVVELASRPPGFGLRVPERIFEMCRAVGLHDIAAKMPRSKNPMNSVKATYDALMNQPDPEEIAVGRGKKLVDARKVYYGGAVL